MQYHLENQRRNHPRKGTLIAVSPLREIEHVRAIIRYLGDRIGDRRTLHIDAAARDYLMFVMGVNNGLRVGDLLKIKIKQVRGLRAGDTICISESKTGKKNILAINAMVENALDQYLEIVQIQVVFSRSDLFLRMHGNHGRIPFLGT
mgnify:CR=1 FL=1